MWKALPNSAGANLRAQEFGQRFREPAILEKAIAEYQQYFGSKNWYPMSLSEGFSGLAIMASQMHDCFPEEGWDQVGCDFLLRALHEIHQHPPLALGLHRGLCGVAFATSLIGQSTDRFQHLLNELDDRLIAAVQEQVISIVPDDSGMPYKIIDIMTGLTGIGAYFLARYPSNQKALAPLQSILTLLTQLVAETDDIPHWFTPAQQIADPEARGRFPEGCVNIGMAHGIAGILALLALASLENVPGVESDTALGFGADWLLNHRVDTEWGPGWPTMISVKPKDATMLNPLRTSWCWGSPGIARSLWLIGKALNCQIYQDAAINTMIGIYKRSMAHLYLTSPTFCHGIAGLFHITLRFAQDTQQECFWNAADTYLERLLYLAEPNSVLGYRDVVGNGLSIERPSLTTGAAGTLLVLLAAGQEKVPSWDRVFLLA